MSNVVSLKSSVGIEHEILAEPDEVAENLDLLNQFFEDPFSHNLKKIFKLKRVRPDDKSVDSALLMTQIHQHHTVTDETRATQEVFMHSAPDVNEGRIPDRGMRGA